MRLSQAWTVARHDLGILRRRRSILYAVIAYPLGVSIGFPFLVHYIIGRAGPGGMPVSLLGNLIDAFSFWFVIAAVTVPTAIASYSIVGEKVEKSLEPLLSTPTTDQEILLGKSLAAFVPVISAIWVGSGLYMALTDWLTRAEFSPPYFPNVQIAILLLALTPLACLFTIEVSVLISARVADVRSAQQSAGIIFLPFILLYIVAEIGLLTLNATHLAYVSGVLGVADLVLFNLSRRTFSRDQILTQWK